jgi:hypothetical protein
MKVAIIGSRDQLCIHEQVKKEANNNTKVCTKIFGGNVQF